MTEGRWRSTEARRKLLTCVEKRGKSPGWEKDKKRNKCTRYPVVKKRNSPPKTTKGKVT